MRTIIFDFDGTIADSFSLLVETFSTISKRSNALTSAEIAKLQDMRVPEILRYLGIKRWQIPRLLIRGRAAVGHSIDKVQPITGIPEALEKLNSAGYKMIVLSTNSPANINHFLNAHNLAHYFQSVHGNVGIFNKAAALKKLIRKQRLTINDCLYIGDEVRDIEAAKKINLKLISVAWGFSTLRSLKAQEPYILISSPNDLLGAISKIDNLTK